VQTRTIKFFYKVIKSTIKARREGTGERKNDMVDLMLDVMKNTKEQMGNKEDQIDEDTLVASAIMILIAGHDTTASTLAYLSYALAKHPEQQKKLQEEVDRAFDNCGGNFPDYSTIQSLPFLDAVIHETLRLYGSIGFLSREAGSAYTLPGTSVLLAKGDLVSFAPNGLHRDPAHWTHPETFHPEHFSKEEAAARSPYAFQAFGQVQSKELDGEMWC
jgi:cytochrome P450 family 3 subfamily A